MIAALVFDFDGVIVPGSENAKKEAWHELFSASYGSQYKEAYERAELRYGRGRGGDRYDILRETFRVLGEPNEHIELLVENGAARFDDIVQKKILALQVYPKVRNLLEQLSKQYPLFLNSATPESALRHTIEALGISKYFRGVYGRPATKKEIFTRIMGDVCCEPHTIMFIGDSPSDEAAAREFGCAFIGVGKGPWSPQTIHVEHIMDIPKHLS